jgi:hypothetical protein
MIPQYTAILLAISGVVVAVERLVALVERTLNRKTKTSA